MGKESRERAVRWKIKDRYHFCESKMIQVSSKKPLKYRKKELNPHKSVGLVIPSRTCSTFFAETCPRTLGFDGSSAPCRCVSSRLCHVGRQDPGVPVTHRGHFGLPQKFFGGYFAAENLGSCAIIQTNIVGTGDLKLFCVSGG